MNCMPIYNIGGNGTSEMTVFLRSSCVPPFAVDICSDATDADLHGMLQSTPCFAAHSQLEFGGVRLDDHAALIADIGITPESIIEVVINQQMNDLQLFNAFIAKTKPRSEVWLELTMDSFSNYQDFANHHENNYNAMVEVLKKRRIDKWIRYAWDDNIIRIKMWCEEVKGTMNGIDLSALSGMKSLRELYLCNANLTEIDLSALPTLTSLGVLSFRCNYKLMNVNFPSGFRNEKDKTASNQVGCDRYQAA